MIMIIYYSCLGRLFVIAVCTLLIGLCSARGVNFLTVSSLSFICHLHYPFGVSGYLVLFPSFLPFLSHSIEPLSATNMAGNPYPITQLLPNPTRAQIHPPDTQILICGGRIGNNTNIISF